MSSLAGLTLLPGGLIMLDLLRLPSYLAVPTVAFTSTITGMVILLAGAFALLFIVGLINEGWAILRERRQERRAERAKRRKAERATLQLQVDESRFRMREAVSRATDSYSMREGNE
ncbi:MULTISPECIES: hypothetical protein [unclassified Arthrobacter]|uniref:hypothetical protein n=1 Tax=unclassified Arthrobacter TaxID=235627 RepID=UPI0011B0EA27|nr:MULTISPECIES: hypothetical protein [unclassified Arthrobacter]